MIDRGKQDLMINKNGWLITFFIFLVAAIESILILNKILVINSIYLIIHNFFIPFFVTPIAISNFKTQVFQTSQLRWMVTGVVVSFLPTTTTLITSVMIYLFSDENGLISITGENIAPTNQTFFIISLGMLIVWIFLILESAIAGLFAKYWFDRSFKVKK